MTRRILALAVLAGTVAAQPAAAQAPAIAADRACYVERSPLVIAGTGFTPGARWSIQTEQVFDFGTANAAGAFLSTAETAPIIPAPTMRPQTFTLVAAQNGSPVAQLPIQVVNHAVTVTPSSARPTSTVTWRTAGWPTGRNVYVHVRRKGRSVGTAKLGRTQGACGTLRTRKRFMPVRRGRVPFGRYTYQVDLRRSFRSTTTPQLRYGVSIFRRVR